MLVMVVFFIAFRWIHLSTPLIRLFLLVLILLLMPTLNFLPVWFALSLLRFRLPSRLPMMFILWMVAMMVEAKMGKVMRHTLGASLNIRHNLSSSKGPKPLQLKLLTTYIPKTSAFTLAFSTSQRLRTTRASARTFFTFRHYITPSARNF